jgi:hypothetical protein
LDWYEKNTAPKTLSGTVARATRTRVVFERQGLTLAALDLPDLGGDFEPNQGELRT